MTEPRIVTSEEAQGLARAMEPLPPIFGDLAHTVATEPDRTRAAVVAALRWAEAHDDWTIHERADAIEKGADFR